ncbi:MAG: flagellar brake protein [Nitrosomonadales bacterium]|nr:flagellar brake protein [Nitrosomonadales bacterium]
MARKKSVSLQVESFPQGGDVEFRILSRKEIQLILLDIAEKRTRVVLYYDEFDNYILTTLIGATTEGVWLEIGPHPPENERILQSVRFTIVSLHRGVKVQFVTDNIQMAPPANGEAFYMELPDHMLRIQRRDFFRLSVPFAPPVKCTFHIRPESAPERPAACREVCIMDISGGGISLLCDEHETELRPGNIYPDCRITLPEVGVLTATLEIKNSANIDMPNGTVKKRLGCKFTSLNLQTNSLLQRYIMDLQSETLASQKN